MSFVSVRCGWLVDNKITIDGETELSFTEDVNKRFESYGWHTQTVTDGRSSNTSLLLTHFSVPLLLSCPDADDCCCLRNTGDNDLAGILAAIEAAKHV